MSTGDRFTIGASWPPAKGDDDAARWRADHNAMLLTVAHSQLNQIRELLEKAEAQLRAAGHWTNQGGKRTPAAKSIGLAIQMARPAVYVPARADA